MIRAGVQASSWTLGCIQARIALNASGLLFCCSQRMESVMKRKHEAEAKNDFFYAFVMFAMFAVMIFNVAAHYFDRDNGAYFADARAVPAPRAA
jgi:hypothetical protein